jgi:hypothetical protein
MWPTSGRTTTRASRIRDAISAAAPRSPRTELARDDEGARLDLRQERTEVECRRDVLVEVHERGQVVAAARFGGPRDERLLPLSEAAEEERQPEQCEPPELILVRGRILLAGTPRRDCLGEPGIGLALGQEAPERFTRLIREACECPAQHESSNSIRTGRRVGHRHESACGVSEEAERLQREVPAELLEVERVVVQLVGLGRVRVLDAPRAEENELEVAVEPGNVVGDRGGNSRPAWMTDERSTCTELAVGERPAVRRSQGGHENEV